MSPPPLASLTIAGALVFDEADLDLTDRLDRRAGHAPDRHHRAAVRAPGDDHPHRQPRTRHPSWAWATACSASPAARSTCTASPRAGWTRLGATAPAGATQLVLASALAWRAGDKLVVASSDFDPNRAEVVTVTARSGAVVTLAQPLAYAHYGELQTIAGRTVDERAEVGLLTRNIVIQGDSATSAGGFGGHLIGMGGTLRVEGVELHFMGQKGLLARYPMHWHMMGPVDGQYFARQQRVEELQPLRHGARDRQRPGRGQRLLRPPRPRLLPRGRRRDRQLHRRQPRASAPTSTDRRGLLPTDTRAATFWITNPDNTIRGNVAAGSEAFGFWYALPAAPTGLSTGSPQLPRTTPLREFSGNVAHSNRRRRPQRRRRAAARRHDRDDHLRPADRPGRRRDRGRGRLHGTSRRTSTPAAPSGSAGATCASPTRSWPTTPPAPRSPRARPSSRTRCSSASPPTTAAGCSAGTPAPRLRVLRRPGGRRPGDVRQLHRHGLDSVERARLPSEQRLPGRAPTTSRARSASRTPRRSTWRRRSPTRTATRPRCSSTATAP